MARKHTVRKAECLATIARKYGFERWQTIYEAPANEEFRKKRPNPNVLYAGDEIVIPEKEQREESGATEQKHRFKLISSKWIFRIEMKDEKLKPLEDIPFALYIDGKLANEGKTGPGGKIEAPLDADAQEGILRFMGEEYTVRFGMLDPISTIKGVQARLNNLGFSCGAVDGIVGRATRRAVYAFQASQGDLQQTGKIDDATRMRLLRLHDGGGQLVAAEEDMSYREIEEEKTDTAREHGQPTAHLPAPNWGDDPKDAPTSDWSVEDSPDWGYV